MHKIEDLTDAVLKYHPDADVDVILDAYVYSAKAHRGQSRRSGEAYFSHPVEVAHKLTRLKVDEQTIAAGLLHDTLEDTLATPDEIKELFGEDIYHLVDGVTKISKIKFSSKEESQAENYRKMILAMARDIRVILIKLADRAHNLETLEPMSPDQQRRISRETMDIYSPLANRLGIGWLKTELENGAFKYLYPEKYEMIREKVVQGQEQRDKYVKKVCKMVGKELESAKIQGKVVGRPKHFFSIHKKMLVQEIDFDDVYDLVGVRILTGTVKDCYAVLGLIHSLWKPISGRFKDYLAMPKPNGYQSLHTTVIGPEGERVEVQIRTGDMHRICEEGIAAHWHYKEKGTTRSKPMDSQMVWIRHLMEHQKELKNPREFLNAFKINLFPHEVYVFTPKGDVIPFPHGATPVDFAYAVHTDIGHHCFAARINGKIVPLRYKLRNGDQVEVVTSKQKHPSRDWLSFVKTSKARNRIANYINHEVREKSLSLGKELLEKDLRELGLIPSTVMKGKKLDETIHACGYMSLDSLLTGIGIGKVSVHHVVEKLLPKKLLEEKRKGDAARVKLKEKAPTKKGPDRPIRVKCFNEDILLRMGKCCNPVPGDPILGYITRGRGVTVHHIDCPSINALSHESERLVEVEWDVGKTKTFPARISIIGQDKPGLLAKITSVLASCDINITRALVQQVANKRAFLDLFIEVKDLQHLNQTLEKAGQVDGVLHLERVKEYEKKFTGKGMVEGLDSNLISPEDREIMVN